MSTEPTLQVKRLHNDAVLPVHGTDYAAGYDLSSYEDGIVPARGRKLFKTGLAFTVPHGTYGRIAPRSGLALKNGIDVGAGVVDEDYGNEVGVILFNHTDDDFAVKKGDRISQLILERIVQDARIVEVDTLPSYERGMGGFGSTGLQSLPKKPRKG